MNLLEECDSSSPTSISGVQPSVAVPAYHVLAMGHGADGRRDLIAALETAGVRDVALASTREDMLALSRTHGELDLIVCSIEHNYQSGCALIKSVRALGFRTAVLAILAAGSEAPLMTLAAVLTAGADDFLQMPFETGELRHVISALIARVGERERSGRVSHAAPESRLTRVRAELATTHDGPTLFLCAPTLSIELERFLRFSERMVNRELMPIERLHLHQALEELFQNAVEWGNRFDGSKQIRLTCCPLPDRIVFTIEDEGDGFDPSAIPDPSIDPRAHIQRRLASGKRMGGWGIFIARKRMDEVAFNAKGNAVRIVKRFPSSAEKSRRTRGTNRVTKVRVRKD